MPKNSAAVPRTSLDPSTPTLRDRLLRLQRATWLARLALSDLRKADLGPDHGYTVEAIQEMLADAHREASWCADLPEDFLKSISAPDIDQIADKDRAPVAAQQLRNVLARLEGGPR